MIAIGKKSVLVLMLGNPSHEVSPGSPTIDIQVKDQSADVSALP